MTTQRNTLLKILNAAIIGLMLVVLGLLFARPAHAGIVTVNLDFNGNNHGFNVRSECRDGPSQEYYWPDPAGDQTFAMSHYCPHGGTEEEMAEWGYPPIGREYRPQLVISRFDHRPFTLHSFEHANADVAVRSSHGGLFRADDMVPCSGVPDCQWDLRTDIDHPLFRNVQWITLCPECGDFGWEPGHHQIGIYDNFRLSYPVPEPPTWSLFAAAGAIAFRRRFAKQFFHWRDA